MKRDVSSTAFDWWPMYEAHSKELVLIAIGQYEHYRNRYSAKITNRFPSAVMQDYRVDRKRYVDAVWVELIRQCYECGVEPSTAMSWMNRHYEYRMSWPDNLARYVKARVSDIKRSRTATSEIPYLREMKAMSMDKERRDFIDNRRHTSHFSESEELAHRLLLGEYDLIASEREHTAAGLIELLDMDRRKSVEMHLQDELSEMQRRI